MPVKDESAIPDLRTLSKEIEYLKEELQDLKVLYENSVDHSSTIENELEEKNRRINELLTSMKMYLSPQLYASIVGGSFDSKLTHKRKKLTMFFSDIENFTDITDIIEPETLSGLLNDYLTEMSNIAAKYGGTIDKYIGDAIVIFFGDPDFIDDETHARQCVRMAIEMLEQIKIISRNWQGSGSPGGLGVRMGINTGFCTVGNFGSETRMDYTMIGGQVNIAARMEKIADRNSVFISEATYSLVRDIVEVSGPKVTRVKGIHYPVKVYKLIGLKREAESIDSLLETTEHGFFLHPISFNKISDSLAYKTQILKALKRAVSRLDDLDQNQ